MTLGTKPATAGIAALLTGSHPAPILVRGRGFRVWGLGFGVWSLGFEVLGFGFWVRGFGFGVYGLCLDPKV